jgi:hypothetical protein
MTRTTRLSPRCALVAAALTVLPAHSPAAVPKEACVRAGSWVAPTAGAPRQREPTGLFSELARRSVVLLGENHDNPEHHRWQLHTLAALHALRPDLVLGFEMFPRRVQNALDQWVAGELTADEFLRRSD